MRFPVAVALLLLLAGCGYSEPPPPIVPFKVDVDPGPAYARARSVKIAFTAPDGSSGPSTVASCHGVCEADMSAQIGAATFTVELFDGDGGGGTSLATGSAIESYIAGSTVDLTFAGPARKARVVATLPEIRSGTAIDDSLGVAALDSRGRTIVGAHAFDAPGGGKYAFALSRSDRLGNDATSLGPQVDVRQPGDVVPLKYNGALGVATTVSARNIGGKSLPTEDLTIAYRPTVTEISTDSDRGKLGLVAVGDLLFYTLLVPNRIAQITPTGNEATYPLPHDKSGPRRLALGPDGALYFTERQRDAIGRFDPHTGTFKEIDVPTKGSELEGIAPGPPGDDRMWFCEKAAGKIGSVSLDMSSVHEYTLPDKTAQPLFIVAHDGILYFTENFIGSIGRITTSGRVLPSFQIPSPAAQPFGIIVGPDDHIWFAEQGPINKIGTVSKDGAFRQYVVPTSNGRASSLTVGFDKNIWFTEYDASLIGRLDPVTGKIIEYPSHVLGPVGITIDHLGVIWFSGRVGTRNLGRLVY